MLFYTTFQIFKFYRTPKRLSITDVDLAYRIPQIHCGLRKEKKRYFPNVFTGTSERLSAVFWASWEKNVCFPDSRTNDSCNASNFGPLLKQWTFLLRERSLWRQHWKVSHRYEAGTGVVATCRWWTLTILLRSLDYGLLVIAGAFFPTISKLLTGFCTINMTKEVEQKRVLPELYLTLCADFAWS